jgi:hypothetical protein
MGYDEAGRITKVKIYFFDGCEWHTFEDGHDCPVKKFTVENDPGEEDDAKCFYASSGNESWPDAKDECDRTENTHSIPEIANEIFCIDDFKPFYAEAIQIVV